MRSKYLQDQSDIFHFSLPLIASWRLSIWHKSMICLGFVMVWIDLIYCSRPSFKDEPKQRRLSSWRGRLHQVPCDCLRRGPGPALGLSYFSFHCLRKVSEAGWGCRGKTATESQRRPAAWCWHLSQFWWCLSHCHVASSTEKHMASAKNVHVSARPLPAL